MTMRGRREIDQPQKLKLIRPSSGYFGYNSKRTDSDTDLGRFSSNNVRSTENFVAYLHFINLVLLLFYFRAFHLEVQKVV